MDDGPRELLDKAQHYRRIATLVSDEQVAQALLDLAQSYETRAKKLLAKDDQ